MGTLIVLFEATIFTGMLYLVNAWFGEGKQGLLKYFTIFLLALGVLFGFKGNATEYERIYDRYSYDYHHRIIMKLQKINAGGFRIKQIEKML